ncbi:MAG: PDZ domain-containing protein [Candidatus Krumholzibacteria bacterium]|nr:PDZ domain-containing protein [Candidatus Krumholzibacteria bacterium]
MKRKIFISLTIIAAISFALAGRADAQKKTKIVVDDKKVRKVEDTGAFLGIYMEDIDDEGRRERDYPKSSGVLVTKVIEDSPAEEAGIEEGDVIFLFAGETVQGSRQLGELVSTRKPGDTVEIVLYREGGKKTVDVALAERRTSYVTVDIDEDDLERSFMIMNKLGEPAGAHIFGDRGGVWSLITDRAVLGVSLHDLSDDLAPYFDVRPGEGVLVLEVYDDTPAAKAGLKDGDVIVEIAGAKVSRYDDVIDALEDVEEDADVTVTVIRRGAKTDIPVKVERSGGPALGLIRSEHGKALKDYKVRIPEMRAIRIQELDEQRLEEKMKELEEQLEELRGRLREMEKAD